MIAAITNTMSVPHGIGERREVDGNADHQREQDAQRDPNAAPSSAVITLS